MASTGKTRGRRLGFAVVACLTACAAGCFPGVTWLPDSSGFLVISETAAADYFVAIPRTDGQAPPQPFKVTKKLRDFLTDAPRDEQAGQAAISPDGKRLAFAKYDWHGTEPHPIQIIIYDAEKDELVRSKELPFKPRQKEGPQFIGALPPLLYWSPGGNHLVVFCDWVTGLYDLRAQRMTAFDWTAVVCIEGSPIHPDGAGFLVVRIADDQDKLPSYAMIDWHGGVKEIKADANLDSKKLALQFPAPELDVFRVTMTGSPALHASHWEKGVAVVTFSGVTLRIDTDGQQIRWKIGAPIKADGKLVKDQFPLADGAVLRTVVLPLKRARSEQVLPYVRVELKRPGKKAKVLVPEAMFVIATPSPNRAYVALRCFLDPVGAQAPNPERLLVLDRRGNVVLDRGPKQ